MDIEWAIDQDLSYPENINLVQARPETVFGQKIEATQMEETKRHEALKIVVRGISAGRRGYGVGQSQSCHKP
jgi:pyruvate, water dikinase